MGELKKIRVRHATLRDIGLFRKLWMKLLEAQHKAGSMILPNDHNLSLAAELFEAYVNKDLDGVVLFVADKGVLVWGDMANPQQLSVGNKAAYGWGHYVEPEVRGKGVLDSMMKEARTCLTKMGFDVVFGSTMENDSHGLAALARGSEVHSTGERPCYIVLPKE